MDGTEKIRPTAAAGLFYDSSPASLIKFIDGALNNSQAPKINGRIFGIISPHAGYMYSGFTAAATYGLLKGSKYDSIVVIGPSHREYFEGASVYSGKAYETPLGKIIIDGESRSELVEKGNFIFASEAGHRSEHSVEVQLPFLQKVLEDFRFVPIVMGAQNRKLCNQLSKALIEVAQNRNFLFVASSDLSHYHAAREAEMLDKRVVNNIENYEPEEFLNDLENNNFEACGGGPIAVVMKTVKMLGANKSKVIYYCHSGNITGDNSAVVGYLSAVFYQEN